MKLLNSLRKLFKAPSIPSTQPIHPVVPDVIFEVTGNAAANDSADIHLSILDTMKCDGNELPISPVAQHPSPLLNSNQQRFGTLEPSEEFFKSTIHAVANDHTGVYQTWTDNAAVVHRESCKDELSVHHCIESSNAFKQSFESFDLFELFEPFDPSDEFFDRVVDAVANDPTDIYSTRKDNASEDLMESGRDELEILAVQLPSARANALQQPREQRQLTDKIFDLPEQLDRLLKSVNLLSPPGLAGDFCAELARYEIRILAEPRIIAALNSLALTRSKQGLYNGMKSGFFSIVAALSACGKERHQVFQQKLFDEMSLNDVIVASVTSGKQVHETLAHNQTPVLIVDECHMLFKSEVSGTDFGALDTIMLMITANVAKFPFRTRRELISSLRSLITGLQNEKSLIPSDKAMLERLIESEKKLSSNNWKNPYFAFVGYSTPINTDFIVNMQNIDSGLMGRPIFMRVAEYRGELNPNRVLDGPTDSLVQRFKGCLSNKGEIDMSAEAGELVKEFIQYFELNRNHREFGAIFARGTEHLFRVSSLLAAETLVITEAEVLYAAKLFLNSLASIQEVKSGKSRNFLFQSALETINKHIAGKKLSVAVLANKLISSNKHVRAYQEQERDIAKIMVQQAIDEGFLILENKLVQLADANSL
jgi:hypothetical protein